MKQNLHLRFVTMMATLLLGIVTLGFQSCGNANKENADSQDDSVAVEYGASIDEDGNIVIDFVDASEEQVGVVEETESNPIDESLERLVNAMANYIKASASDNDVMKKVYADEISKEVRFLNKHKDEMTDSQKQLYAKLNAIEI